MRMCSNLSEGFISFLDFLEIEHLYLTLALQLSRYEVIQFSVATWVD